MAAAVSIPEMDAVHATDDPPPTIRAGPNRPSWPGGHRPAKAAVAHARRRGDGRRLRRGEGHGGGAATPTSTSIRVGCTSGTPAPLRRWPRRQAGAVDIDGDEIEYNKSYLIVRGFVIARPFLRPVLDTLTESGRRIRLSGGPEGCRLVG